MYIEQMKNIVSSAKVPAWGNTHQYIAVHYLGVDGQNNDLWGDGYGAHYFVYWDGTIYWRCSHDAVVWAVGASSGWKQIHPYANNYNTISIEMCCHCDGDSSSATGNWYFTEATQKATVELVQYLMKELNLDISHVLRHGDITTKPCPAPYIYNTKYRTSWTWDEFLNAVKNGSPDTDNYSFTVQSINLGSNNTSVLLCQEILKSRNLLKGGQLDWKYGQNTFDSVKEYQRIRNLVADGVCGAATWADMLALPHNNLTFIVSKIKNGDKNVSVFLLQEILLARGYKGKYNQKLSTDWDFGINTEYALKTYQKDRGLTVDGICGPKTWRDLLGM